MRAKIDGEICSGHGRCAKYAPNVYELDSDGYNAQRGSTIDVPAGEEANAQRGARSCPERAIAIEEK